MTVYALNGLGRIGKLALRPLLERGAQIAFINDAAGTPDMMAYLLEFDSVHGRWPAQFDANANSIKIDDERIYLFGHSMGGGGSIHLATKYPKVWAAIGVVAPAAYGDRSRLAAARHIPFYVV